MPQVDQGRERTPQKRLSFESSSQYRRGAGVAQGSFIERSLARTPSLPQGYDSGMYRSFIKSVEEVRDFGRLGVDLRNVEKGISPQMNVLRRKVQEKLPVEFQDEKLVFYTALGTAMDIFHGVDCFFECGDQIVTVDISLQDKPEYKADVLMMVDDEDGLTDPLLERYADKIAQCFGDKRD